MQSIIDKYSTDEDNTFSNEDVLNIATEIKQSHKSSLFNNKLVIATCALAAVVADRAFVRTRNVEIVGGGSDLPPIRHLQTVTASFADWTECDAVATVPKSYVGSMGDDSMTYLCKATYGCEKNNNNHFPSAHPTSKSTPVPTASPVKVTSAPTADTNTNDERCYNTVNFGYGGDSEHSCEWIQRTDFRRNVLCTKKTEVREACPVVCGTCCDDNPNFLTDTPFGRQGCDWIGANALRKIGYCPVPDVGTFCPLTCDKCGPYISMAPSMFGTSNETSAPTGRLDDD